MNQNQVVRRAAAFRNLQPLLEQRATYDAQHFEEQIFNTRLAFIEKILARSQQAPATRATTTVSHRFDQLLTGP